MYLELVLVIVLLVIALLIILTCGNYFHIERFDGGPSNEIRAYIVDKALANRNLFNPELSSFEKVKSIIPEMDNIMYEDFRQSFREGRFERSHLYGLLG
jgi:hypothetical protein